MKKAKLGKAPSPSAVSCHGLIQCSARVSGSLCSAGACRPLQQSWLAWLGWCIHSDEPASHLLSLEQRPVNPWTRSTLESFQRSLNSLPEAAGLCSGSGRKVMQTSDPDVLPGLPGHACNLPGSSQKPICCRRNHSTTATLNCMLGYACLPQGEGQLPKHTCLMAACWGKTPCARAAAQLCHMPARSQRSPSWHPTRGRSWTNLPFLLLPSLPPLAEFSSSACLLHPNPEWGTASQVCSVLAAAGLQQKNLWALPVAGCYTRVNTMPKSSLFDTAACFSLAANTSRFTYGLSSWLM